MAETNELIKKIDLTELQNAIINLTELMCSVDNCGGTKEAAACQTYTCQFNTCQGCQSQTCQTCQGCQTCQKCQTCQTCQTCQGCQKLDCQRHQCQCNCSNCSDCNDEE